MVLRLLERHDRSWIDPAACWFSVVPADPRTLARADAAGAPFSEVVKQRRYDALALPRLVSALRELRAGVVVAHGYGAYSYAAVAARLAGARAVVRVEHSPELYSRFHRLVSSISMRLCDSTVLVSRYLVDYLRQHGTEPRRPEVIYNGVELERFASTSPPPGRGELLMVARLDVAKDHATLLDALALLARRGVTPTLRLAGDGPFRGDLERQAARLGLSDRVIFLGHQTDLPALLGACDVAILSTRYEGFGLAVVEAMAAARPVVATRVAAIPELFEHGKEGLLVEPRSASSLADALAELLADPARARRLGEAGQKRARAQFSLEGFVAGFEAHLRRITESVGLIERNGAGGQPTWEASA